MAMRPDPLMPPGVDLRGHEWFPFYPERLRKSRWWRRASDLARARNVMLWGEAFKSVPAGSIPDDDDELAEAAGFGMDAASFIDVKAEIMAPWTLCSDGRWYHPTVCEMALDAWERLSEKRKGGRERQARFREKMRDQASVSAPKGTSVTAGSDAVTDVGKAVTRHSAEMTRYLGEQDRTGQNKHAVASKATATGSKPWARDEAFGRLWAVAPTTMKRRSSQKLTWPEYRTATKQVPAEKLLSAFAAYQASDEDFKRTGGPGLHIWLKANRWEAWLESSVAPMERTDDFWRAAVQLHRTQGRWSEDLGPPPGQPECKVPRHLSIGAVA